MQDVGLRTPTGFRPVAFGDTGLALNPDSATAHASAIRTLMLYMLTEAFDLRAEEQVWAGWALDEICAPLLELQPHTIPLAARQEMLNGTYSRLLELRGKPGLMRSAPVYDSAVVQADIEEWAQALMAPIVSSYALPAFMEAKMKAHLVILLTDLGVDAESSPRGATHLPTELRQKVLAERAVR